MSEIVPASIVAGGVPVASETTKTRYTDAEKKNFLADQKDRGLSNREAAKLAGVSESTFRGWKERFSQSGQETPASGSVAKAKRKTRRPKARKPESGAKSLSVTDLRVLVEQQAQTIRQLETELAVIKPVAKFYLH
jgi:transposase-like protein